MNRTFKQWVKDAVFYWFYPDQWSRKTFDNYLRKLFCQPVRYNEFGE